MIRTRYAAASAAGLLPAIGIAVLLAIALSAGLSGYVVHRWNKGTAAIAEAKQLKIDREADRKFIADLKDTAQKLRQHGVDQALAYQQATERMDAIAAKLEQQREANRQFAIQQQQSLAALAAARPDLRDMRLGDDFLRHWNRSIQGGSTEAKPGPAAAPAERAGKPARTVPGPASGNKQRSAGAAGQPGRRDRAVPRLPGQQGVAGRVDGRVAGDRLGLVLQRGQGHGAQSGEVPAIAGGRASAVAVLSLRDMEGGR